MAPRRKFGRVAVLAKPGTPEGQRIAVELGSWLSARGVAVRFDEDTARASGRKDGIRADSMPKATDLVIVAGGDGTLLSAARIASPLGIPTLGVNFGGLGFMTELQPEELYRPLVVPGEVSIEVTLRSQTEEAYLTLDGQVGFPMRQLDTIVVDRHPRSVRLLRVARRGFFEVLQRKLHWGGR